MVLGDAFHEPMNQLNFYWDRLQFRARAFERLVPLVDLKKTLLCRSENHEPDFRCPDTLPILLWIQGNLVADR